MRVTQSMLYRQTLASMNQNQSEVVRAQDQLASGIRLNQAMDDPAAMSRVMRNDDRSAVLQGQLSNISALESRLGLMESELSGVTDLMHRGRELMIAGANATQSAESRSALAIELRSLGESLLSIANGRDGQGRYLFAGQDDTAPAFTGTANAANYQGSSLSRQIPIDDQAKMSDSLAGDALFLNGPTGDLMAMFGTLAGIVEAPTPDLATTTQRNADMAAGLQQFDDALGHVLSNRAELGTNLQRLESSRERIETVQLEITSVTSSLRDTDFAAVVSQMSLELTSLEAARTTFTQIQGLSLFNFIR
jgi:flagellar hook-associated protein 3 FlgL